MTSSFFVIPVVPLASHPDGLLRQSDLPPLPGRCNDAQYIYRLIAPDTHEPGYVGKTKGPATRLNRHRNAARNGSALVYVWWRAVVTRCGLPPVMQVIDGPAPCVGAADIARALEAAWEAAHRDGGFHLHNSVKCGGARPPRGRWTERELVKCLRRYLDEREAAGDLTFPTQGTFRVDDQRALWEAMEAHGGYAHWVKRMGYTPRNQPWDDERIEVCLSELLKTRAAHKMAGWPTKSEMDAAGYRGLSNAVSRHGVGWWADRLGVEYGPWTEERLDAEARAAHEGRDTWMSQRELACAGREDIRYWARQLGGERVWAERIAVRFRPCRRWNDTSIRAALEPLCAGSEFFPSYRELSDAGLGGLAQTLARRRAFEDWARRMGLPRRPSGSLPRSRA